MDTNTFSFSEALKHLKTGRRVARRGWNGKGMHLYLAADPIVTVAGETIRGQACIVMFTAAGLHQPGWLASQADLLAEDWVEA